MSTPTFRPKYVSFDCYGTLISWPMTPITKELVGDQIPAEQWDQFVAEFRGYRYDQVRGEYYPYDQVLQDAFDRVCRKWGIEVGPQRGEAFRRRRQELGPAPGCAGAAEEDGRALQAGDLVQRRRLLPGGERAAARGGLPRRLHRGAGRLLQASVRARSSTCSTSWTPSPRTSCTSPRTPAMTRCRCTTWVFATWCCWTVATTRCPRATDYVTVKSLDELNTMLGI